MSTESVEMTREERIHKLAAALRFAMQEDKNFSQAIAKSFSSFPDPWEALSELVIDVQE